MSHPVSVLSTNATQPISQKCDAKRPCSTCIEANCALRCEYQAITPRPRLSNRTQFTFLIEPGPSSLANVAPPGHQQDTTAVRSAPAEQPVVINPRSIPEPVPPARALIHSVGRNSHPPFPPPEPRPLVLNQVRARNPTLPRLSVLPTLVFPSIPPEPHLTLSSLGPERFQLSDPDQGELDMRLYVHSSPLAPFPKLTPSFSRLRAMCRLGKFGIRFASEKQQALLRGDTSGSIIHPFFILAAQSLGMQLCEDMGNSPAMVVLYAKYVQKSLEFLTDLLDQFAAGPQRELQAQAFLWITMGSIVMRLSHVTSAYIKKACEAVDLGGLRFVPTYDRPPVFSEQLHEKLSVLSQIIYFENFLLLTRGGVQPTMSARIEKEFRHKLQVLPYHPHRLYLPISRILL